MPIARRLMFALTSAMILTGIGLSGWSNVHGFLYVTPLLFGFFSITGICPQVLIKRIKSIQRS